ncbi:MAG: cysteine desulfurase NifS [Anaerofustis sp.]
MKKFIYADNAATTALAPDVLEKMMPYLTEYYGNASSIYTLGQQSKEAIENARKQIADIFHAEKNEIYFTASGTEADNWAIKGAARANKKKGNHIISTQIEHHAVLHSLQSLEREGYEVTYLPVDEDGLISIEQLQDAIKETTILITVMYANNEIGTIEPISEIGMIAREKGILFHTDAVQAAGHEGIDVHALNVDLMSVSAHKFNGPKGVGALYIRKGTKVETFLDGGAQENNRRAGTENVAGIVGMAAALERTTAGRETNSLYIQQLRDRLTEGLLSIPYTRLNGSKTRRLNNNVNVSFQFVEGESILLMLNANGICASSGSACTSGSLDPSHVLLAIGLPHEIAHGSTRYTLSEQNTQEEVDYMIEKTREVIQKLRDMSPLYEEFKLNEKEGSLS